jgi:hypothetical protein
VSDLEVSPWDEATAQRPATDDDLDGFYDDAPSRDEYGVDTKYRGRYHFPAPPGYVIPKGQRGFMRMTNMAAAFSDQIRLQKWRERMVLLGLRADEVLVDELFAQGLETMDPAEAKAWLEDHAERAAEAAGAGRGARAGTARHTMLQVMQETGVLTGSRTMRLQLHSLWEALERHYLEPLPGWSERRVCHTGLGVIGTLDMAVRCKLTGQTGILDLKTQRRFWSYLEICGQQYGYDSAPWVWEGPNTSEGSWVEAPDWDLTGRPGTEFAGRRVALLAHMPQEPGPGMLPVEIHEVALDYGQEVMELARRNVELRSRGSSVAKGRRVGALRPVPKIVATVGLPPEL